MNAGKLALLAVAISIAALGVVAYAQQTVYVNGSYVILLPNTTMSPLLKWLLYQTNVPVPQSGILIPVSDLPNVTVVTGYTTWYVYMNLNYTYISARWTTSNMPSTVTATYTPSNATLKFTVPSGVTATNAKATVNFTLGPWNYIIPNSVYGYEENYGTFPVLWLPLTIWDKASGTYNFSITAFMTFPNGTTKQVPVITPNGYPVDMRIFLNPWNNSYDYYVFTYQNAAKLNKSLGILVTRTTSYVDVGIPIGALLYSEVPVNITLVVTAFYNATTSGTMGISLYMPVTSIKAGTYTYYYTSESNYAYIADVYAGFDGYAVTSPLYIPNFTCYINIVQQLFECYEGNHFVPVAFRGGLLTGNFSGSYGLYPLFIEYPYYFYRFGGGYSYVLYPNGTSVWMYDDIGGYQSWLQTAPAYVSTAVGSRLAEAVGVYWHYPGVPNYQWQAMYTELPYMWWYTTSGLFTNITIGTLFYGNYTKSDLANRLTFSVTAPEYDMYLTKVSVGGYTFWANAVDIVGINNVMLGNTLTSGYSLVVVLNPSTLNIINTYKVPAGSNVTLQLGNGNYLIINMIPPQYNATEANVLNLAQNPQYYPFAWSFDPTAQVYYISVSHVMPNIAINLSATAYPLLLNVTVYAPSGAVSSSTVNMTGPTQLVVPQTSNITINVISIPRGYELLYTQWSVNFTDVLFPMNYTFYLVPIIPINVTFISLCPSYTLSIFNEFNGSSTTLHFSYVNTTVLYYGEKTTYSVTSYSSECKPIGPLTGIVTTQYVGIPLVLITNLNNTVIVPWYGYSIPQQYLNEFLMLSNYPIHTNVYSSFLDSQLLMLPPPPKTVDYYYAIPIVPLPWSNATGFIPADLAEYFNGIATTPEGTEYIENSATKGIYLVPIMNYYNVKGWFYDTFVGWIAVPIPSSWVYYGVVPIQNKAVFPAPLVSPSMETPYYVPANMTVNYANAIPITINAGFLNITYVLNFNSDGLVLGTCPDLGSFYTVYQTSIGNMTYMLLYNPWPGTYLGIYFEECYFNVPLTITLPNGTTKTYYYNLYNVIRIPAGPGWTPPDLFIEIEPVFYPTKYTVTKTGSGLFIHYNDNIPGAGGMFTGYSIINNTTYYFYNVSSYLFLYSYPNNQIYFPFTIVQYNYTLTATVTVTNTTLNISGDITIFFTVGPTFTTLASITNVGGSTYIRPALNSVSPTVLASIPTTTFEFVVPINYTFNIALPTPFSSSAFSNPYGSIFTLPEQTWYQAYNGWIGPSFSVFIPHVGYNTMYKVALFDPPVFARAWGIPITKVPFEVHALTYGATVNNTTILGVLPTSNSATDYILYSLTGAFIDTAYVAAVPSARITYDINNINIELPFLIQPLDNITINAFVGGPWSYLWQPGVPPGAVGFGIVKGGVPYPYGWYQLSYLNTEKLWHIGTPYFQGLYNPTINASTVYTYMIDWYPYAWSWESEIESQYQEILYQRSPLTPINVYPLHMSDWPVVNMVSNTYGTIVVPAAFGNSSNSVITASFTTTIPLSSFKNLASMQIGEVVQGLLNGTFTATYKYGPYTYIVQLTATPIINGSSGTAVLDEVVTAERTLLVNGEVVFVNTTKFVVSNYPLFTYATKTYFNNLLNNSEFYLLLNSGSSSSVAILSGISSGGVSMVFTPTKLNAILLTGGFSPIFYTLPQLYNVTPSFYFNVSPTFFTLLEAGVPYTFYFQGASGMFPIDILRSSMYPMLVDSEILSGDYGALQVTYQLTEYPIKVTYNETLIYAWYQGPNAYNYTVTQYLFPAVLITPSIYALVNATTQPVDTFYAVGYFSNVIYDWFLVYLYSYNAFSMFLPTYERPLSLFVIQNNISGVTPLLYETPDEFNSSMYLPFPAQYINSLPVPLIGLYTPPYNYPLPLMFSVATYTTKGPLMPYPLGYAPPSRLPILLMLGNISNTMLYALPLEYKIELYMDTTVNQSDLSQFLAAALNNPFIAINEIDIYDGQADITYTALVNNTDSIYAPRPAQIGPYTIYHEVQMPANITITNINGTDLICIRSNLLTQIGPVGYYPMSISGVVPSLDVGIYYVLGSPLSGFFIPLFQAVNVTNLCFVPVFNGTYFIIVYMPPQRILKNVYLSSPAVIGQLPSSVSQIINAMGASYTPELIVLTNTSFAMDYRDVVNPMSPDVLWLNIVQPQYVTVTTNLTALKLLFPNVSITPFSVNVTSNGTLTSSGTGVVIVNASSTSSTPITYSGGASTSIMKVQFVSTYFAGVTAKVVLNTVGTDLTPLVARFGLPLFSVNGTASTSPITVLALPKANDTIRICIPPVIGPIVVVNSGCFIASITANETLPLVIYVRLPVNLNITAINNNGKLVVKVSGTDFFGNPVVYYPINVTVYLSNHTATYTAVIRNGVAEVSTGLPYQGNTLVTAQGNGTGAYLPASATTYVPVTSVSTLPPWLAYIGSIWWLLLLVILLIILIVIMIILERKRAKKRRVRAYTPYWV